MYTTSSFTILRKLICRFESRHRRIVGDAHSNRHSNLRLLNHSLIVPVGIEFIRRLMIVLGVISIELLFTPTFWPAHKIIALFKTDRRHANFRKRKVIGSIERTLFRTRVGRDAHASFARYRLDD